MVRKLYLSRDREDAFSGASAGGCNCRFKDGDCPTGSPVTAGRSGSAVADRPSSCGYEGGHGAPAGVRVKVALADGVRVRVTVAVRVTEGVAVEVTVGVTVRV